MLQKQKQNQYSVSINRKRDSFRFQIRKEFIQSYMSSVRKQLSQYNNSNLSNNQTQQSYQSQYQKLLQNTKNDQKTIQINEQQNNCQKQLLSSSYKPKNLYAKIIQKRDLYFTNFNKQKPKNVSIENIFYYKDYQSITQAFPIQQSLKFIEQLLEAQYKLSKEFFTRIQIEKVQAIAHLLYLIITQNILPQISYSQIYLKKERQSLEKLQLINKINNFYEKIISLIFLSKQQELAIKVIQDWVIPLAQKSQFYKIWLNLSLTSSDKIKQLIFKNFTGFFHKNIIEERFDKKSVKINSTQIETARRQIRYFQQFQYIIKTINNFITSPPKEKLSGTIEVIYILCQTIKTLQLQNSAFYQFEYFEEKDQFDKMILQKTNQKNICIKFEIINQSLKILISFLQRDIKKGVIFLQNNQCFFLGKIFNLTNIFINHYQMIDKQIIKMAIKNFYTLIMFLFGINKEISKRNILMFPQLLQNLLQHLSLINSISITNQNSANTNISIAIIITSFDIVVGLVHYQLKLNFLFKMSCIIFDIYLKTSIENIKKEISKIFNYIIRVVNSIEFMKQMKHSLLRSTVFQKNQIKQSIKLIHQKISIIACKQITEKNYSIDCLLSGLYKMTGCLVYLFNNFIPQKVQIYQTFLHILSEYRIQHTFQKQLTQEYEIKINDQIRKNIQTIETYLDQVKKNFEIQNENKIKSQKQSSFMQDQAY